MEARALIAVQESSFPLDELPAALVAIRDAGVVEELAVAQGNLDVSPASLASTHSRIVVIKGTPIIQVTGLAMSGEEAVLYANSVAESLTEVLNRSGALGVFEFIERAGPERIERSPVLPGWPLAVFAGVLIGFLTLLASFVLVDPIYTVGDIARVTQAEIIDQVWLDPKPPMAGKVRSAAAQLDEPGAGALRLLHAGWGEDMTPTLEYLLAKFAPTVNEAEANVVVDRATPHRTVVVVMEGTPMRKIIDLETSLRVFPDAIILVHPRLA